MRPLHLTFAFFVAKATLLLSESAEISGPGSFDFWPQLTKMLVVVSGLLAVLLAGSWLLKRMLEYKIFTSSSSQRIKLVERKQVSPKTVLYLIQVEDQQILAAETPQGVQTLGNWMINIKNTKEDRCNDC